MGVVTVHQSGAHRFGRLPSLASRHRRTERVSIRAVQQAAQHPHVHAHRVQSAPEVEHARVVQSADRSSVRSGATLRSALRHHGRSLGSRHVRHQNGRGSEGALLRGAERSAESPAEGGRFGGQFGSERPAASAAATAAGTARTQAVRVRCGARAQAQGAAAQVVRALAQADRGGADAAERAEKDRGAQKGARPQDAGSAEADLAGRSAGRDRTDAEQFAQAGQEAEQEEDPERGAAVARRFGGERKLLCGGCMESCVRYV